MKVITKGNQLSIIFKILQTTSHARMYPRRLARVSGAP
jgi:hypothetical protein